MGRQAALKVVEVNHRYERGALWTKPLSFTWAAPQAIAITGPNGTGKSTLLSIVGGLLRPTDGTVSFSFEGASLSPGSWRQYIAWLSPHLYPPADLTIQDLLQSYIWFKGLRLSPGLLEEVQLQARLRAPLSHLSSGQCQRLLLALTLALQRPILILDEPTAFLDEDWKAFFHDRLRRVIEKGQTLVLCATNDPSEAALFPENLYLGTYAA